MFNEITLVGRLTKDAHGGTMRNAQQTPLTRFTLAVDRDYETSDGERPTDFWPVEIIGPYGERVGKHLFKGRLVLVSGSAHLDSVKDEDGNYHTYARVTATKLRFLDKNPVLSEGTAE